MFGFGQKKLTREHIQEGDVKRILRAFGGKKIVLDDLAMFAGVVKVTWRPYARPEIHALFSRLYENGDQPLRYYATQVLAYTQAPDAIPRLIAIMESDSDTAVRDCAVQCLEEFKTPTVREALLKACERGDWCVSSTAAGILARWRERRAAVPIAARMMQLVEVKIPGASSGAFDKTTSNSIARHAFHIQSRSANQAEASFGVSDPQRMKATGIVQMGRTMLQPFTRYRSALYDVADASNVDHLLLLIRHMPGHDQRMFAEMLQEKAPDKVVSHLRDQKLDWLIN